MPHRVKGIAGLATALMLALAATAAARDSRVADAAEQRAATAVSALLTEGADVNAPQPDGATALHWAVYWDDLAVARALLRAGADPNAVNEYGVTPLVLAATNGSERMITALLPAGARARCGAAQRPDAAHDGGANRNGRGRQRAAVGRCGRGCRARLERADGADVGHCPTSSGRDSRAHRAWRRRRGPHHERLHPAAVCGARGRPRDRPAPARDRRGGRGCQ